LSEFLQKNPWAKLIRVPPDRSDADAQMTVMNVEVTRKPCCCKETARCFSSQNNSIHKWSIIH